MFSPNCSEQWTKSFPRITSDQLLITLLVQLYIQFLLAEVVTNQNQISAYCHYSWNHNPLPQLICKSTISHSFYMYTYACMHILYIYKCVCVYIYYTLVCIFTSSTDTKIRKCYELVRLHWKSSENAYVAGHIFISKPFKCVKIYLYTQVYLYTLKLYYFCNVTDYRYGVSILVCVWQSSSVSEWINDLLVSHFLWDPNSWELLYVLISASHAFFYPLLLHSEYWQFFCWHVLK